MDTPLRIAISGLGRIGWGFHAEQLRHSPDFVLSAMNDSLAERRAEARQAFGCEPYASYDRMLERTPLDAVVIASPTHLHKPMALAAFRHGLHVLLEKPMALNATEAASIVRAAARAKRVLTVYQPRRLMASFQQIHGLVRNGVIGRLCRVQVGMFSFSRRDDWQSLRRYGGGMLNNYGAHGLDQVLQLCGYDVRRIFCSLQTVSTLGDADDAVKVLVETRRGIIGELDISQASPINPYSLNLWGSHGGLMLDVAGNRIRTISYDPSRLPPRSVNRSLASAGRQYPHEPIEWQNQDIPVDPACAVDVHANFAAAIRGREPLAVPPGETLRLMRLLDRLREHAGRIHDFRG